MKLFLFLISFYSLIELNIAAYSQGVEVETLFVLYDAGETNSLIPLIEQYKIENRRFRVLTMGTANTIFPNIAQKVDINNLLTEINIDAQNWLRTKEITKDQLVYIVSKFSPEIVITGVVSKVQEQISEYYANTGKVIGFYDSFAYLKQNHPVLEFKHTLDQLWIPSKLLIKEFKEHGFKNIVSVGQPSLEKWKSSLSDSELIILKKQLHLNEIKKTLMYIGSYGMNYERGLIHFVESVRNRVDSQILISLHPKSNGLLREK